MIHAHFFHLGVSLAGICLFIELMGERATSHPQAGSKGSNCSSVFVVKKVDSFLVLGENWKRISVHTDTHTHSCVFLLGTFIDIISFNLHKDLKR